MVRHYAGFETGLWFIAEVTEGITPTASPAFLNLAHKASLSYSQQGRPNVVAKSGDRDNTGFKKGVEFPVAQISFNPSTASGKAFIKTFIDTDTSFTLLAMIDEASDVIFGRFLGCKIKRVAPSVSLYPEAKAMDVTCEIWAMSIVYTNAGLTTPTFESPPATFVNWSDCVVKKNTNVVVNWWDFAFTMDQELYRNPDDLGAIDSITRGRRTVEGVWTQSSNVTSGVGNTELDEQKNATAVDLQLAINGDLYDFADCAYQEVEITHPLNQVVGIQMRFQGATFSVI